MPTPPRRSGESSRDPAAGPGRAPSASRRLLQSGTVGRSGVVRSIADQYRMESNAGNGVSDSCHSEGLFMRVRISIVLAALAVTLVLPGIAAARGNNAAAAAKAD